jgi:hypothetical protein
MCWTLNHQNIIEMAQGHISLLVGLDDTGRHRGWADGATTNKVTHGGSWCDIPVQGLREIIEYSYQQGACSFSEACLERTSALSMLGIK